MALPSDNGPAGSPSFRRVAPCGDEALDACVTIRQPKELWLWRLDATLDAISKRVGDRPVYLSFDIDVLDPAFAPGTGTPVSGGLATWQALELIRGLGAINMIGMDLVEVSPPFDHAEITAIAAATVAHDWLCVMAERRQKGLW